MDRKLIGASMATFLFLLVVNGVLFPLVFPDGLAEKFANARPEPLNGFHVAAFLATAVLLTHLVGRLVGSHARPWEAGAAGAVLGLFVALPEHLHLYAMVDATALRQFTPVVWTTATWGVAGWLSGRVLHRGHEASRPAPDAERS